MKRILVVGPSKNTRGGITSVIKTYRETKIWRKWNCVWIATFIDKSKFQKIFYFLFGLFRFIFLLPNSALIHIHFSEPTSAKRKNIFLNLGKFLGKKIILHFHAFSPQSTIYGKDQTLYKRMFNNADAIIALSNSWKNQIEDILEDKKKITVIHNSCPQIPIGNMYSKSYSILFAGTLNDRKGYTDLIKAFAEIAHKYKEWNIVFAGNGDIKKAKSLADSLKIEKQVKFLGWIIDEAKDKVFKEASIFCLPSYAEGFPMAVLDAFAYGLPVITTPVGGLPDILVNGENALMFEPGNINELANKLEELIKNESLRNKISEASLSLSQGPFSIKNISSQLDILYTNLSS